MELTVGHIVDVMEEIAPASLAEPWDNVGLHVGNRRWPVRGILVALDPSLASIRDASERCLDLVVCHHPLIFRPLSRLDPETGPGQVVALALHRRVAVFCAHTNLDSVPGGVNDMLVQMLGLSNVRVLAPSTSRRYRLVTYVPRTHEEKVMEALFQAGAGKSDKYSHVSFRSDGEGSFRPLQGARPFTGEEGRMNRVAERRLEVLVEKPHLTAVIGALVAAHPYEEVVYDAYPVEGGNPIAGLGRVGTLDHETNLGAFSERIKQVFGVEVVKLVGDPECKIRQVALCGGSGKSLVGQFLASGADVFVSGDLGYHEGRMAEDAGRALIDMGHFFSERIVVDGLVERLKRAFVDRNYTVAVEPYRNERCCFRYV